MLRLIVLGEIPGTHINLTFFQVLLILGGMYWLVWRHLQHRQHTPAAVKPEDISL